MYLRISSPTKRPPSALAPLFITKSFNRPFYCIDNLGGRPGDIFIAKASMPPDRYIVTHSLTKRRLTLSVMAIFEREMPSSNRDAAI